MIDAKLLQSFMSDIERMKTMSNSSANGQASGLGANSALSDPFAEILARTLGTSEAGQSQENLPLSEIIAGFQLVESEIFNTWVNPENNKSNSSNSNAAKALTTADIDSLFPDLANLNNVVGPYTDSK
jgi:hypothetical protein